MGVGRYWEKGPGAEADWYFAWQKSTSSRHCCRVLNRCPRPRCFKQISPCRLVPFGAASGAAGSVNQLFSAMHAMREKFALISVQPPHRAGRPSC